MIVQPTLVVPTKIAAGLATGELILIGGVVRNASTGRLVTLLKDAPGIEKGQEALGRAASVLRSRVTVVSAAVGALAAAGTYVVVKKRNRAGRPEVHECVAKLNASLRTYLDAGRAGRLDAAVIDQLISDLNTVRTFSEDGTITIDFSTDLWEALVGLVVDHTGRLADAYSVDLPQLQGPASAPTDAVVVDLCRHLEAQRDIVTRAA